MRNGRAHAIGWAAAIIGVLLAVRMLKGAGGPPYGIDAAYYFQLARHVMNGEGLVTTVSLYHEGWVLPAKTPIYPLWPLMLGYAGRVIGLERAADLLPRIFYCVNLVLLYVLARAIALRIGALRMSERWWMPDCAHWMVAIFALTPRYFGATTHPYTEGPAFAMAFASFLALARYERTRGLGAAAASGLFAGLAFLVRTQMVGVAIGCFVALAFFAWRERSRLGVLASQGAPSAPLRAGSGTAAGVAAPLWPLLVWGIAAVVVLVPWFVFLGFIPGVLPMSLPRVELPKFEGWTEFPSRMEWLKHRAGSLGVMFDPSSPYSYVQSFGVVAFLVALAAVVALVRRKFAAPRSLLLLAVFVAGLFFFFNLMLYHSEVWMPWLFGWRHGLPFVFLIALAVPWLAARAGRFAPVIAIVLLISVATNARNIVVFVRSSDPQLTRGESEVIRWLEANRVSAIATNAQVLGSMTDAHLYWSWCDAPPESTRAMLRLLPVKHIVLYEHEYKCRFVSGDPLRLLAVFGDRGQRVMVLTPLR